MTQHRFASSGHYLVRVERTNEHGQRAIGHLHVLVGQEKWELNLPTGARGNWIGAAPNSRICIGKYVRCAQISGMSPSFETLVEQVRTRSLEEKEELKFLLERALVEERRREIRANHGRSSAEVKRAKLKFSSSIADLKKSLAT